MADRDCADTAPHDEPLLVLRYRRGKVVLWGIIICFAALLFGLFAWAIPMDWSSVSGLLRSLFPKLFFGFLFLLEMYGLAETLCSKEIRLYNERIVKTRRGMGNVEVQLAHARFQFIPDTETSICLQDTKGIWPPWRRIICQEHLVGVEDAKKLVYMLARLSGRTTMEFRAGPSMWSSSTEFIRKGSDLRVINRDTIEEDFQREEAKERDFNRAAGIALAVFGGMLLLGLSLVFYFMSR